jgi:hypothetical protein
MSTALPQFDAWWFCQVAGYALIGSVLVVLLMTVWHAAQALAERMRQMSRKASAIAGEAIGVAMAWPFEWGLDQADKHIALAAEWRKQRKIWRTEFRATMKWREFKRQMEGAAPRDELTDARNLFGLAERFTRAEFDAKFKRIIQRVHPDMGGSEHLARLANDARALILKRKGWRR